MGMRCKRHAFQDGGGVCATCLRDRLLVLAAAQNDASSPPAPAPPHPSAAPPAADTAPAFPRSVSPYVSRRKSDSSGGALRNHPTLLFFRTPQVGPSFGGSAPLEEGDIGYDEKRRGGKFSVLSTLFGNHHHHRHSRSAEDTDKDRKNRSWLAGIIPRRRKKQQAQALPPSPPPRRSCRRVVSNRGLSPERGSQEGSGDESSSPADPPWRPSPSPMRKTPCRLRQTSGLAFCLSPLVRPSPGRRHRAAQPPDPSSTFSCEFRPSPLHSASSAASVPRCRSRKLADAGRFR